jgi:hypothetical protein
MLIEGIGRLLDPGYLPDETSYRVLPNGQSHASVLTRFPGSSGEMFEWWIAYGLTGTERYRMWDPKAHLHFEWDSEYRPGHYIGASHYGEELMGNELLRFRMRFDDPAQFFDASELAAAGIEFVVCCEALDSCGTATGRVVQTLRRTNYGGEMRSRMWMFKGSDKVSRSMMEHCIGEMGNLADMLPDLYVKECRKTTAP